MKKLVRSAMFLSLCLMTLLAGCRLDVKTTKYFAYAVNYGTDTVNVYSIGTDGRLTDSGSPASLPAGSKSRAIAADPSGRFIYTGGGGPGLICAFSVNQDTGTLTSVGTPMVGGDIVSMMVDPSGKFLYGANAMNKWIEVLTINQTTGAVTHVSGADTGSHLMSLVVEPLGRFLYAISETDDNISDFIINSSTGNLGLSATTTTGPSPLEVVASDKYVYVMDYKGLDIRTYTIQTSGGLLFHEVPFAPFSGTAQSLAIAPSGKFLYAGEGTTIHTYSIDQTSGDIAEVGTGLSTTAIPHSMAIDQSGKFLYITDWESDTISPYSINQTSGELTAIGSFVLLPAGSKPWDIAIAKITTD